VNRGKIAAVHQSTLFGDSFLRIRYAILLSILCSLVAKAGPPPVADEAGAIRRARLHQNAAIVQHDVDAIASYWTDDVTICRGLGAQVAGKVSYRKLFEEDDPNSKDVIVYQRVSTAIEVSTPWPLAFETGVWKGYVGDIHGVVVIQGHYAAQWVKRDDRWLIRSEVFVALDGSDFGLRMKAAP
jgi:ketosteroid isomerase-like protein